MKDNANRVNIVCEDSDSIENEINSKSLEDFEYSKSLLNETLEENTSEENKGLDVEPEELKTIITPKVHQKKDVKGLSADGRVLHKPVMVVEVEGIRARALIDTGSDFTHVSGDFAKKLVNLEKKPWSKSKLYAATGIVVTPRYEF